MSKGFQGSQQKKHAVLVAKLRSNRVAAKAIPLLALCWSTIGHGDYHASFTHGPNASPPHGS